MKILSAQMIAESTYPPKINVIALDGDKIIRYLDISISRTEIEDIKHNTGRFDIDMMIESKVKRSIGEEVTPEEALEQHPNIRKSIIHLLRDKKINDLLD